MSGSAELRDEPYPMVGIAVICYVFRPNPQLIVLAVRRSWTDVSRTRRTVDAVNIFHRESAGYSVHNF